MKNLVVATLFVASLGFVAGNANAQQNSATATATPATATIVAAIGITSTAPLNFGQVITGSGAGTVIMTSAGERSIGEGTTTLGNSTGSNAASFTVTGNEGNSFVITLPSAAVTLTSGANTMTVIAFNTPEVAHTIGGAPGTFAVGATLNVGAGQLAGDYTGTFAVTVAYE